MQSSTAADAKPSRAPPVYPVFFIPNGVGTPTSDLSGTGIGHPDEPVELSARLALKRGQVYLNLTCRPREATSSKHSASPPAAQDRCTSATNTPLAPSRCTSTRSPLWLFDRTPSRVSSHQKESLAPSFKSQHRHAGAASTPSTGAPHLQPEQHYTIALTDISPFAAQRRLSAELRARLHLTLVDRGATTYPSHVTSRARSLSPATCDFPETSAAPAPHYYPLPSRSPPAMFTRSQDNSISAHQVPSTGTLSTRSAYGQYLEVTEPWRSNERSLLSLQPIGPSEAMSCSGSSSCFGEDGAIRVHNSMCDRTSQVWRATGSRLLTPLVEKSSAIPTLPAVPLDSLSLGALTPLQTYPMNSEFSSMNVLSEYEELLSVAFFGVTETASIQDCAFSSEDVLMDKKSKVFGHGKQSKTQLSLFSPLKKYLQRTQSARIVSTPSDTLTDALRGPVTPLQLPRSNISRLWKSNRVARSPALASSTHADSKKVLALPFIPNRGQTFCLRFLNESDMRDFLSCYVGMQAYIEKMQGKKKADGRDDGDRQSRTSQLAGNDEEDLSSGEHDAEQNKRLTSSLGSPPTATYEHPHPCNAKALGTRSGSLSTENISDYLLSKSRSAVSEGIDGGHHHHSKRSTSGDARLTPVRTIFGCRGWQDYVRYRVDPRYGVTYATVPLFLWHSFLPLASSVLYTCQRGFLIVERLRAPSSPDQSKDGSSSSSSSITVAEFDTPAVASKQRLNSRLRRLLTPIRAAQEIAPAMTQSRRRQALLSLKDIAELLPTSLVPVAALETSASTPSTRSSWDGVKGSHPSADNAACQPTDEYVTTFKDVFLCLSESHLLFLNSFGHLWLHFSFDEVALITHSAATDSFPTHPFVRFRLKANDWFEAPISVLTFTLLPEVPQDVRVVRAASPPRQSETEPVVQRGSVRPKSSLSVSACGPAPWFNDYPPGTPAAVAEICEVLLEDKKKEQLLHSQKALLDIFETVCPRPLERCTFTELMSSENSTALRKRFWQLISRASGRVSGSPLVEKSSMAYADASLRMAQQCSIAPILCVRVDAGNISISDSELKQSSGVLLTPTRLPLASPSSSSTHQGRDSQQCSLSAYTALYRSQANPFVRVILRWGPDDPGIVLQDAGHDMDLSLEQATRTMPLLACKEGVSQGYRGFLQDSPPQSLYPVCSSSALGEAKENRGDGCAVDSKSGDADGMYAPIAPKKRRTSIIHRAAVKKQ
ncbi:hypothetical protein MNV84_06360 [Leishmania braziliensis]|nr:hypothetical protein MNV84_06360 [Leishmania braziliensis]